MNAQDDAGAMDVSKETEPNEQATEQTETVQEPGSFQDALLKMAEDSGHEIGDKPPVEVPEIPEAVEGIAEGKDSEDEEPDEEEEEKPEETPELKPAAEHESIEEQIAKAEAKGEKAPWYLKRIAEEADKKRRASDRAEKAELVAQQLQAQLQKAVGPQPTEDNPFIDVDDEASLIKLEKSYNKAIELAIRNPHGAEDVLVGVKDGQEIRRDFSEEELAEIKWKAELALRQQIPERKTYLQERAVADAEALQTYPDFKNVDSEFTQVAAIAAQKIMNGQAAKEPQLLIALGDYARGYLARIKDNGTEVPTVKTPEARRILESSKQKIAPTPVRSRSIPERKSSVSLEKADAKVKKEGTREAAEEYLTALWSKKGGSSKRVESISE